MPTRNINNDLKVNANLYLNMDTNSLSGDSNGAVVLAGYDSLTLKTQSSPRVTINSSGNVGIGTTSPQASLHVAGYLGTTPTGNGVLMGLYTTGSSNYGNIQLNGDTGSFIDFSSSGTDWRGRILYDNSSNYMRFDTGGTERVRINSSGNVGIGTTTLTNSSGYSTLSISGTTGGQIAFQTSGTGKHYLFSSALDFNIYNSQAGNIRLYTSASEKMRITSAGQVLIGRTSNATSQKLQVEGFIDITDVTGSALRWYDGSTFRGGLGLDDWATSSSAADLTLYGVNNLHFVAGGSNNKRMTILSGGNVGIGTSSPAQKLHVNGNVDIDNGGILLQQAYGINFGVSGYDIVMPTTTRLGIKTAGTEHITILNTGNVGIGTTSPEKNLSIGNAQAEGIQFNYDTTNNYRNQILNYWNSNADSRMDFNIARTSGQTPVTIMSVGYNSNVGIGATTPENKLHILTSTTDTSSQLMVQNGSSGDAAIKFNISGQSNVIGIDNSDGNKFKISGFSALGTYDRLTIDTSGNVGIGTTNPAQKLDIGAGHIRLDAGYSLQWDNSHERIEQSDGHLEFFVNNTESMTLDTNGLSLTTSLTVEGGILHLGKADTASAHINSKELMTFNIDTDNDDTNRYFAWYANGESGSGTELLRIEEGGNVGIGITDPDQKLDVNGNIRIPNQGKIVFGSAGTATDYLQLHDVVAGNPLLKLVQDNVERFSIEGVTGNVTVSGDLTVNGNISGQITKKISGDGSATTFTVTHSFGTPHVMTQLLHYGNNGTGATYEVVNATVKRNSDNAIDVVFGVAPTSSEDYLALITKMPAIS